MAGTDALDESDFNLLREKDPKEALEYLIRAYVDLRDSAHGDYPGKGHPDPDFLQARMRYLAYYRDEGYSNEQLCKMTGCDPMQVQLLLMHWDEKHPKLEALSGERWWISWYEPSSEAAKPGVEGLVRYACTGQRMSDDAWTICALVDAPSIEQAKAVILQAWPTKKGDKEWRFVNAKPKDWKPDKGRFGE